MLQVSDKFLAFCESSLVVEKCEVFLRGGAKISKETPYPSEGPHLDTRKDFVLLMI